MNYLDSGSECQIEIRFDKTNAIQGRHKIIKKVMVILFAVLITKAVCAADDAATNDTGPGGDHISITTTAAPESTVPEKHGGYWDHVLAESLTGKLVLLSSLAYFNYEMTADRRMTAAILLDSGAAAGLVTYWLVAGNENENQSPAGIISSMAISLCITGLMYYPVYALYDGYTNYDYRNIARGWIGAGFTCLSAVVIAGEKFSAEKENDVLLVPISDCRETMLLVNIKI
jgi:hypothetical protein